MRNRKNKHQQEDSLELEDLGESSSDMHPSIAGSQTPPMLETTQELLADVRTGIDVALNATHGGTEFSPLLTKPSVKVPALATQNTTEQAKVRAKPNKFVACGLIWLAIILAGFATLLFLLWRSVNPVWVDISLNQSTILNGQYLAYSGGQFLVDETNHTTFRLFGDFAVSSDTPFLSFNGVFNATSDGDVTAKDHFFVQFLNIGNLTFGNGVLSTLEGADVPVDLDGATIRFNPELEEAYTLRKLVVGKYVFYENELKFGDVVCPNDGTIPDTCGTTPARLLSREFDRYDGEFLGAFGGRIVKRIGDDVVLCKGNDCKELIESAAQKVISFAKLVVTKVSFALTEYEEATQRLRVCVFEDERVESEWEFTDVVGYAVLENSTLVYSTGTALRFVSLASGDVIKSEPSNLKRFTAKRLPMGRVKVCDASQILSEEFELRGGRVYHMGRQIADVGPLSWGVMDSFGSVRVVSYSGNVITNHVCTIDGCKSEDLFPFDLESVSGVFLQPPMIVVQTNSAFFVFSV